MKQKTIKILVVLTCIFNGLSIEAQNDYMNIAEMREHCTPPEDSVLNKKQKLIMDAKKLSFEGNIDKATDLYRQAIVLDPECDVCYYELANIQIFTGNEKEAHENAKVAYLLDPENSWYSMLYGRLCFHFKDFANAQTLFRKTLRSHAGKQEIWFGLASVYEEQGLFSEAQGILDTMIIRFGEDDDISYRLFNVSMDLKNYDKAIDRMKKLVSKYPDDPRFATLLAEVYFETEEDSLAIRAYDRAIEVNESFTPALLGKAELFRKKGQFSQYFKAVQQYAANRNILPETKAEYIDLILRIPSFAGYFKSNIDTLFAILSAIHPASVDVKMLQARYFVATQRLEPALAIFGQLTAMDGDSKEAWTGLLALEYSLKMYEQLELSARKAIDSDPKYADFYMYQALSLMPQKKVKQAIDVLEKSMLKANCDSAYLNNVLSFLGDMYFSIKKSRKAFAYYEKALKNNPENALALNNYAYSLCSTKSKDLDKAYQMSKKAIELDGGNSSYLDTYAYILYLQGKYTEAKTVFRKALAVGGDESAVVLDHYADTLNKLGERTVAEIYWSQALDKPDCPNSDEIKKKLKRN